MVVGQPVGPVGVVTRIVMAGTWVLFAVDFVVRLALAERRGPWLLRHWYDLAVIALPVLRPLRLLRLVTLLGGMRRSAGTVVRGQAITYAAGWTVVLLVVSSLAVLNAERGASGASIQTWGESLWWATVTATLASWLLERIAERDGAGVDRAGPGEPGPGADPPGGSSVSSGP